MTDFQKGLRGALMGLAAYLINVTLVATVFALIESGLADFFGTFVSFFLIAAVWGGVFGLVFMSVGILVAGRKSPREAIRPLIITSVIVLTAVGGCFGMLGIF